MRGFKNKRSEIEAVGFGTDEMQTSEHQPDKVYKLDDILLYWRMFSGL